MKGATNLVYLQTDMEKTVQQQNADERYMRHAIDEAHMAADEGEIPIGAIIVSHGRIIARAHNQTEVLHDVTAHAEMLAITAAANELGGKYLTDCTLYVTVEPCPMCAGATPHRLWHNRRETRLSHLCPKRAPSQSRSYRWHS